MVIEQIEWTAKQIKALRAAHKKTQEQFCKDVGVVVGTLRYWEQGFGKPGGSASLLLDRLAADVGFKPIGG